MGAKENKRDLLEWLKAMPLRVLDHFTLSLNRNTIEYWQTYIFYTVFIIILSLGLFMYIPNLIYALRNGLIQMVLLYTTVLLVIAGLFFYTGLSIKAKTIIFSIIFYFLGTAVIYQYGPAGDGAFFFFVIVLMCSLFIGPKSSILVSVLNLLIGTVYAWLYMKGICHWDYLKNFPPSLWFITNVNVFIIQIVFAIAISQLIRGVKKTFDTINKTKEATIIGLAKLTEYRDTDTGMHLERIGEYAALIADELSGMKPYDKYVTRQYIDDIKVSSSLHDIGKVGIPDAVLLKPGKLDPQEFEVMKKHSLYGKLVIEEISKKLGDRSFLDMALSIAHHHHEKWNGSGYPDGLSGEDIPLSARIIALADAYDAMTTKRIYKEAFSHEKAVEIIAGERGKQFDPTLTDIFIRLNQQFNKIRIQYSEA